MSQTMTTESVKKSRSAARVVVALVMIVALVATGFTREWALDAHADADKKGALASEAGGGSQSSSLSAMPSYATALLLGGLRGPLVMILWTTSENQKQQHDLQDFDTKVEWIRLLQPEFDTVHLFQIWNKAYNISVLMADQANKYVTILDAIEYANKVDRERPDDINILTAEATTYGDKLGSSQEHPYYRRRVRKETQTRIRVSFPAGRADDFRAKAVAAFGWNETDYPLVENERDQTDSVLLERPVADRLQESFAGDGVNYRDENPPSVRRDDPTWRRLRLDPMLDADGNLLPDLLRPRFQRPADLPADAPFYDGSQLQFLQKYQPFPYGVSTLALAYNYYKRAQMLQEYWGERHIQSGDTVVDSRPAINLKLWGKDESERGRRAEARMWGRPVAASADPDDLEAPTAAEPVDAAIVDPLSRDLALYSYKTGARLFDDARLEYLRHINNYKSNAATYLVHIDDSVLGEQLMAADYDYLLLSDPKTSDRDAIVVKHSPNGWKTTELQHVQAADRNALIAIAMQQYGEAAGSAALTVLKYYGDEAIMKALFAHAPPDPKTGRAYTRATIESANDPQLWIAMYNALELATQHTFVDQNGQYSPMRDQFHDDRAPYENYVDRCRLRSGLLHALTVPTTQR